jgi:hypothetical protein
MGTEAIIEGTVEAQRTAALEKIRAERAGVLRRPGGWVFLGIFTPFVVSGLLRTVTPHAPGQLGDRPEFYWTWALIASGQLICWSVSILAILWDDLKTSLEHSPGYFVACGLANVVLMMYASITPVVRPELLGPWRVEFSDVFGTTTLSIVVSFICLGSVVGGVIIGIAGSQFDRLAQLKDPSIAELAGIYSRTKRSFMCLAILLTLAVFSTWRLYAGVRLLDPAKYTFLGEITLAYGILMSFLLVLFYLPVILRYHAKAQAALDHAYKDVDLYGAQRDKLEERERMRAALGLTALSGVESLIGALGPVLTALGSVSSWK